MWLASEKDLGPKIRSKKDLTSFGRDLEAVGDILWQAIPMEWFECPMGSRLHYFSFPKKYCNLARDGVLV